jgi:hypothetical protein
VSTRQPLLSPGDPRWEQINREEREQNARRALRLTPGQRVELGLRLIDQAFAVLRASRDAGHVPRRIHRA